MFGTVEMSVRQTTLYTVALQGGRVYETFDWDKARLMQAFALASVPAAECVDCKAVIPVALVDKPGSEGNRCPNTTSLHFLGHRVLREEREAAEAAVRSQS